MNLIESFATRSPCYKTNLQQLALDPADPRADSRYQEYYRRFAAGDIYLFLHSLGCARASAAYQVERWNVETNEDAIAHAVIDSNTGDVVQALPWAMRAWHVGSSGNSLAIGIEMAESDAIAYDQPKSWLFTVKDRAKAERHCRTTYNAAVELFARLCKTFGLDPATRILSHKESHALGIGSNHGDPEHYWSGMSMPYTMDGFRADVADKLAELGGAVDPAPGAGASESGFLGFPDVSADAWYAEAMEWAVEHKIVLQSGKPFRPNDPIDKATFIVLLRRLWIALQPSE